jgi:hypothetical protein
LKYINQDGALSLHFELLAISESMIIRTAIRDFSFARLRPTVGVFSSETQMLVKQTLETILHALEQAPTITAISLSSARAVGILTGKQRCPEEAREILKEIKNLGKKIMFTYHSDESLRCQCQQKLLAAGGRVLESWTLHERLYLTRMENLVNLAEISSKVGYPVSSLLELSRQDMYKLLCPQKSSRLTLGELPLIEKPSAFYQTHPQQSARGAQHQ